ncbi:MAG: hypothetical protein AB4290_15020 [Spirulina sp.]
MIAIAIAYKLWVHFDFPLNWRIDTLIMSPSQSRRMKKEVRSPRFVLSSVLVVLVLLCFCEPVFAHSGHSHQRNVSPPVPTPKTSPSEMNVERTEQPHNLKITQPTPSVETSPLEGEIPESNPTINFITLMGEGLFVLLFIVPLALTWLKRNYHQNN